MLGFFLVNVYTFLHFTNFTFLGTILTDLYRLLKAYLCSTTEEEHCSLLLIVFH